MFDINTKNVKKGRNVFVVFFVFGISFLIIIGSVYISTSRKAKSMDSVAVSTNIEVIEHHDSDSTTYSPRYYYEVNGKEYICTSTSASSSYPDTTKNKVYYDSSAPANCITEYDKSSNSILLVLFLLPIIFIAIGVININKINKRVKLINELNQRGKLVKKLPYRLEDSNISVNNRRLQMIVVDYTLPNGVKVPLYGDPRYDRKHSDEDGFVDLLIDEQNPDNYFIDFEINRLTGNGASDYYQPPSQQ